MSARSVIGSGNHEKYTTAVSLALDLRPRFSISYQLCRFDRPVYVAKLRHSQFLDNLAYVAGDAS